MVKRYPHKAIVFTPSGGELVNGVWVEADGDNNEIEIIGRYDPMNNDSQKRFNSKGDEVIVKGEFYTREKPNKEAFRLVVEELGIDQPIITWWGFQSYSIIYI